MRYCRVRKQPAGVAEKDEQALPAAVSASVSIACSACGRKLKVRAELAGKKVKCPQCREALVVPAIEMDNRESRL
jgi:hypothetical protein